MTRSGPPDDPNDPNYYSDSEPTAYANYGTGGYAEQGYPGEPTQQAAYPPEPETPWYRKPAALVALGAVAALLVAAIIYVAFNMGDDDSAPTDATTTSSETSTSAARWSPWLSATV
jgi:hypothetical protein